MKIKLLQITLFTLLCSLFFSCEHYPEDPWYSRIKNPKKRIENSWDVKQVWVDGIDSTENILTPNHKIINWYYNFYDEGRENSGAENQFGTKVPIRFGLRGKSHDKLGILRSDKMYFDSLVINNLITFHGAIGNPEIGDAAYWDIREFTKDKLLIKTIYNGHTYKQLLVKSSKKAYKYH